MRRILFFFLLFGSGVMSASLQAFPAGRYVVHGGPNSGTALVLSVSVPNGGSQTVTVTGGRIEGSPVVASTSGTAEPGDDCLRLKLKVTNEDSFGRHHTYIVEINGCTSEYLDGDDDDDQVGSYHQPGSHVVEVLKA